MHFGLALGDIILCSFAVFAHFTTIKRNKIKSNLCRAPCTAATATTFTTVRSTKLPLAPFNISSTSQQRTHTQNVACKTLILFFIFFSCTFFPSSLSIVWPLVSIFWLSLVVISNIFLHFDGHKPQEISIISLIIAYIPNDVSLFSVWAHRRALFSHLSVVERVFFLFAADLPSFILKHNERTMAISLIRWSIGMQ